MSSPGDPPAPEYCELTAQADRFGLVLRDGCLAMEEVSLEEISTLYGTPCYVYGLAHLRRQFTRLEQAFAACGVLICYAVKANGNLAILRELARLGAGADIVSGGELARALAAGVPPDRIVFSGVGKLDDEIDAAIAAGVRSINVESTGELDRVAARARASGRKVPVSLRINPAVDLQTHPYLATGLRGSKFGIDDEDAEAACLRAAAMPELELLGLACHIGSQLHDAAPFLASLQRLRRLAIGLRDRGIELRQIDLGGGLGIPYRAQDPPLDVEEFGRRIVAALADLSLDLVLEPGRFLVGNAGVLLTRVIGRKQSGGKNFLVVDAAMNDLLRPALYDAHHGIVPLRPGDGSRARELVDVVGPVCECGDFLATDRVLPVMAQGELLAVLGAGAYGSSMGSNYNTRPLAPEVVVEGARHALVRPRQTIEQLLAQERIPPWLQ